MPPRSRPSDGRTPFHAEPDQCSAGLRLDRPAADHLVELAADCSRLGRRDDRARLLARFSRTGERDRGAESTWAALRRADGACGRPAGHLHPAIAAREFAPRLLRAIQDNRYRDPVPEPPERLELRARIHPSD